MIRAGFLKKIAALTVISFAWLLVAQTGFLNGQEDPLRRARQLFLEGDYPKTLALLDEFISSNKGRADQKKNVAEAYYLKAKIYHVAGEEDSCDANLKLVFETHPEFTTYEPDIEFRERAEKTRALVLAPKEIPGQKVGEEAKPGAMGTGGKPLKPKKFPWLLVGGVAVAAGVAVLLLMKKKAPPTTTTTTTTATTTTTTTTIPATTGNISVSSIPTGAKIYLDNTDTGKTTNDTLTSVSPGAHTVKLVKEGYLDYQQNVTVTAGQTLTVNATLTKNTITVTSPASGASWTKGTEYTIQWATDSTMSESRSGNLPFPSIQASSPQTAASDHSSEETGRNRSMKAGGRSGQESDKNLVITNVNIDLYKSGAKVLTIASATSNDFSEKWTVPASQATGADYKIRVSCATDASVYGESAMFSIADPITAIYVTSTPTGAKIYLDNTDTGKTTNNTLTNVTPGAHAVKLVKEGYRDYEQSVTAVTGQTVNVNATLTKNTITVTGPAAGVTWAKGTEYTIQWTTDSTVTSGPASLGITNVNIDLYKSFSKVLTIASNTSNDLSEKWTVPASQTSASDYKIRVSCATDSSVYGESGAFNIADFAPSIVASFASPGSSPTALEWDGNSLWMVDNLKRFYELDTNGNVRSTFNFNKDVYDLAWDGNNLWAYTDNGLLKLDRAGNVLATLNVHYWPSSGFAWDGTHFWVGDYNMGKIYKHDAAGNLLLYFEVDDMDHPTGIAFNGTNLLIGDCFQLSNSIYIYSRAGVMLSRLDLNPLGLTRINTFEEKALAWDGQFLWYSSTGRFTIYKIKIQ